MNNLNLALNWADHWENKAQYLSTEAQAAIDLIRSLPDAWVDAEKLKVIIADMDHCLKMESTTDFSRGIDNATTSWRDALKALIMPDPPEPKWPGFWEVDGLEINVVDKDGEVLIEWEDDSDYAPYGTQTRTRWLNRQQVLAIVAAANPRKGN